MRVGIFNDAVYRRERDRVLTSAEGYPFLIFACEVGSRLGSPVIFGRAVCMGADTDHPLPLGTFLVELPYYPSLRHLGRVVRSAPRAVRLAWTGMSGVDAMWVFGPHPFGVALILLALLRRRRVIIGVRADPMRYFRARLPSRLWIPVLAPLWLIDRAYRVLSRFLPTTVVGDYLERAYGGPRRGLLSIRVSLVPAEQVLSAPSERDWSATKQLLTVGRIDAEKNPLLLIDALGRLERERPGEYALTLVGSGPLEDAVRQHARDLGLSDRVELAGFIPFGAALLERYRAAHIFVHAALTESFGQVLVEAMASSTPIVATAVGGVADTLAGGSAGLLVPPRDAAALAAAIRTMSEDRELRTRCVTRGLEVARQCTLQAEAARVATFIESAQGVSE